ncbi:MAG: recombinase RecA, partial [Candidatus Binatia bacterium]
LIARKMGEGDIGASANTIILMGKRMGKNRVGRALYVAKHRGSACSTEIAEYALADRGLVFS